ncbi:hypothetical protein [Deinococcus sp. 6GRE01]|uniref:hypothetical protein n=1 Tax=Deinococcus sp. 6GRE01 TaxID=2745873 RepID=UPI001E4B97A2|nr:hypothetical protein [Deinococcus sp. 6GRE01]MCD0157049.1 hypothetical protein [Deinococcus sp. 6GRE01]
MPDTLDCSVITLHAGRPVEAEEIWRALTAWHAREDLGGVPQHRQNPDGTWAFLLAPEVPGWTMETLIDVLRGQYPRGVLFRNREGCPSCERADRNGTDLRTRPVSV